MRTQSAKRIRTVIIGLGKIAWGYEKDRAVRSSDDFPTHVSVLREHPNFQLVAVQDKDARSRKSFLVHAKSSGLDPRVYDDWEEMIQKEKPDLVVVATNTMNHYAISSRVIGLGIKHILCEKPISYSLTEARQLVEKAQKKSCALYVNYVRAFNPSYIKLCRNIQRGLLGRIQSFDFTYTGGLFNNGTHALDLLIRMFGEIKQVKGFKNSILKEESIDPTASAAIEFKNGMHGYLRGLNSNFYSIFELHIFGELGRIVIASDKVIRFSIRSNSGRSVLKVTSAEGLISTKSGLDPVYDNIYTCILSGDDKKNRCSGKDALRPLEIAQKILESMK